MAAPDGWRQALVTREVTLERHRILVQVDAILSSHRAFLRQLAATEEDLGEALAELALPTTRRLAVQVSERQMEHAADTFVAGWRDHLLTADETSRGRSARAQAA
jgi:hypothetical protein